MKNTMGRLIAMVCRRRWVIMRNNRKEIFCGFARNYQFKEIDNLGNTSVKTYLSKNKAIASFENCWYWIDFDYEAVEVVEKYEIVS